MHTIRVFFAHGRKIECTKIRLLHDQIKKHTSAQKSVCAHKNQRVPQCAKIKKMFACKRSECTQIIKCRVHTQRIKFSHVRTMSKTCAIQKTYISLTAVLSRYMESCTLTYQYLCKAVILFDKQRTENRYYSDLFSIRGSTQNHDFVVRANNEQHNRPIKSFPATKKTDVSKFI